MPDLKSDDVKLFTSINSYSINQGNIMNLDNYENFKIYMTSWSLTNSFFMDFFVNFDLFLWSFIILNLKDILVYSLVDKLLICR